MNRFKENIRSIRTKMYLMNQGQMAEYFGVGRSAYAAWEEGRGRPNYEMLIHISDLSGMSIDNILRADVGEVLDEMAAERIIESKKKVSSLYGSQL